MNGDSFYGATYNEKARASKEKIVKYLYGTNASAGFTYGQFFRFHI